MALKKGYQELLAEAQAKIRTVDVAAAQARYGADDVVFVDLRDPRELEREGMIPGALHAPRGMLEFWVDPASPYYREVFGSGKEFVLYCQSGWRSVLAAATLEDMGLPRVAHLEGGYRAWKDAGAPTAEKPAKPAKAG
jgi:rhodanese-related sulfurtransferase